MCVVVRVSVFPTFHLCFLRFQLFMWSDKVFNTRIPYLQLYFYPGSMFEAYREHDPQLQEPIRILIGTV